jgi:hypothetical protein
VNRGTTLADLVGTPGPNTCGAQYAARGLVGMPTWSDPWSRWNDHYYGGLRIGAASNIVFSNGQHDPWSAGGVLCAPSPTTVSFLIPSAGHHLDLFFSTPEDSPSLRKARALEEKYIRRWIQERADEDLQL